MRQYGMPAGSSGLGAGQPSGTVRGTAYKKYEDCAGGDGATEVCVDIHISLFQQLEAEKGFIYFWN